MYCDMGAPGVAWPPVAAARGRAGGRFCPMGSANYSGRGRYNPLIPYLPTPAGVTAMFPRDARIEGYDPELAQAIADERRRQEDHVELIASENYASPRAMEAQGSVLTNKYAERSEERRVGKECVSTCRCRGSPYR